MRLRALFAIVSLASLSAFGCSSEVGNGPETSSDDDLTPAADQELADLDIGPDELVADEAESDDELVALDWPEANPATPDEDLESDLDEVLAADFPEELPDPGPDPADIAYASPDLGILAAQPAPWWSEVYSCERNPLHASCVCRGSLYNCQFPNSQPGRNRYLPPAAVRALKATSGKKTRQDIIDKLGRWELASGQQLYDGTGQARGEVSGGCYKPDLSPDSNAGHACVKINFGQVKSLRVGGDVNKYVYAFATSAGSGWVARDRILNASFKAYDTPPRGASSFAATKYVLKAAEDYGCQEATYDSTKCLPAWAQLKIRPNSSPAVSEKARDYMLRDGNVQNLAYQTPLLGGAADDTFLVRPSALGFRRARSIDSRHRTILRIALYHPLGTKRVGHMYFVFGEMAGRNGWVAVDSLKKGSVAASTAGAGGGGDPGAFADTCDGKDDGLYCSGSIGDFAYRCTGGVPHGGVACPFVPALCHPGSDGRAVIDASGNLVCDHP
jgi:hypothetical protein